MKVILSGLVLLFATACSATNTGHGFKPIESMSESAYTNVLRYLSAAIKAGIALGFDRGVLEQTPETRAVLADVARVMKKTALEPASESASDLLTSILDRVESLQKYRYKEVVVLIIEFAEDYIEDRGGFGVIQISDGTFRLSERTKKLLLAISGGIEDAIAQLDD